MSDQISSTYHMNNIPRGTSPETLLRSLAHHWRLHDAPLIYGLLLQTLVREPIIHDSKLDDRLSVTTLEFKDTPKWFKELDRDPDGFPKRSRLGTLWRGVDMTRLDVDRRTEFTTAVIAGDLVYAETLAEFEQTDVNSKDAAGRTALHWACVANSIEMAGLCLSLPGIDTSIKDADGLTAFDISCGHQDEEQAMPRLFYRDLFEVEKSDPDDALLRLLTRSSEPDLDGAVFPAEALLSPVNRNNLPLVAAIMETGVQLTATNDAQETALHLAAKKGCEEMINFLLTNSSRGERFDVDAVTEDGRTPLHCAAVSGHVEVVHILLERGANKEVQDSDGRTALDCAVEHGRMAVEAILDSKGSGKKNLEMDDSLANQPELFETVTGSPDPGINISMRESNAASIFIDAVARGDEEKVIKLLDQGTSIESSHERGLTALHVAVNRGEPNMVKLLLSRGAYIDAIDQSGDTPTLCAAIKDDIKVLQVLLDSRTDTNYLLLKRWSIIHSVMLNHPTVEVMWMLLDHGADIEAKDYHGRTPLRVAVTFSDYEIVKLLIDRGADVNAVDDFRHTVFHYGRSNPNKRIVELLTKKVSRFARSKVWLTLHVPILQLSTDALLRAIRNP